MAEPVSRRKLASILGVADGAVRKAIKAKRISVLPSGLLDPDVARAEWSASTDPARSKVRTQVRTKPKVRTEGTQPATDEDPPNPAHLREGVALIKRVLGEEGIADDGGDVDYSKARTAELILKARQRSLDQNEQERRLVDRAAAERLFFEMARDIRDAWLAWPPRVAVLMASELNVDARKLASVLAVHVHQHLTELGEQPAPEWEARS